MRPIMEDVSSHVIGVGGGAGACAHKPTADPRSRRMTLIVSVRTICNASKYDLLHRLLV
jgi:hypothetical protein